MKKCSLLYLFLFCGLHFVAMARAETNEPPTCTFTISPLARNHSAGVSTGTVSVATGSNCVWAATTTNAWITLLSSGGGDLVIYRVEANAGPGRTGFIRIADGTFTVGQAGQTNGQGTNTSCIPTLSPTGRSHNAGGSNATFAVAIGSNCVWAATSTNGWIALLSPVTNVGPGVVAYQVEANSGPGRTGHIRIEGRTFTVIQAGITNDPGTNTTCIATLSPSGRSHNAGASNATVAVAIGSNCLWTATSSNAWIAILSPVTNVGSGLVAYQVEANPGPGRTGQIRIDGRMFTINQAGITNGPGTNTTCTYALSPSNGVYGAQGGTGFVSVATQEGCPWNVFTSNYWIHIGSSLSNAGSGTVLYFVDVNQLSQPRTGVIRIDGRNFFVNQAAAPSTNACLISISPTGRVHGAGSETAVISITVPPDCTWGYVNTNAWISTLPIVGAGNGGLQYTVAANNSTFTRTGIITISGLPYVVTQLGADDPGTNGACTAQISPLARTHVTSVSTGTVTVAIGSDCFWETTSTNAWISLLSPATNAGSGLVVYRVEANSGPFRTGFIRIDGQTFTVRQSGLTNGPGTNTTCTFEVSPLARPHDAGVSTGTVSVATGPNCLWPATSTNAWITVLSPATNFGNGTVVYRVDANAGPGRSGYIRIDGRVFTVAQAGLTNGPGTNTTCTFEVSPLARNHPSSVSTGTVSVGTGPNCLWLTTTTNGWITVLSSVTNFGSGTVVYRVTANAGPGRTGYIRIDGRTFTVGQAGVTNGPGTNSICTFEISPRSRYHGAGAGVSTGTVFVATGPNCLWLATSSNAWITVLSPATNVGSGTVVYQVDPNPGPSRTGLIRIDGKLFVVGQEGLSNEPGTNVPPALQMCPPSPGVGPMLFVNGPPAQQLVVECSEDLIHWTPISTNIAPSAVIDWSGLNAPRRFYRPVLVP